MLRTATSVYWPYVDSMGWQVMFVEKSWGSYRVLDVSDQSMTIKVILNPCHGMNYHSHERRNEVWTVVYGFGIVVINGVTRDVSAGEVINLPFGCKHTVSASSDGLQIVEVQMGEEISVKDKKKWEIENVNK